MTSDLAARIEAAEAGERDWYARRHELRPGMIFRDYQGEFVQLDRGVPGDGTRWYVADWWGGSWAWMDSTAEPGDLRGEPLSDAEFAALRAKENDRG